MPSEFGADFAGQTVRCRPGGQPDDDDKNDGNKDNSNNGSASRTSVRGVGVAPKRNTIGCLNIYRCPREFNADRSIYEAIRASLHGGLPIETRSGIQHPAA